MSVNFSYNIVIGETVKRTADISNPFGFNFAGHISCERWAKSF